LPVEGECAKFVAKLARMRKVFLFVGFLCLLSLSAHSQRDKAMYLFYSTEGDLFYILLGGITQNEEPMNRFLLVNVPPEAMQLQAKIIYFEESLGEFKAPLAFEAGRTLIYEIRTQPVVTIIRRDSARSDEVGMSQIMILKYKGGTTEISGDTSEIITSMVFRSVVGDSLNVSMEPLPSGAVNLEMEPGIIDYAGPTGCSFPMGDVEFLPLKAAVESIATPTAALEAMKGQVRGKCLRSDQCLALLSLFASEQIKLEAAKLLYPVLWDRANVVIFKESFPSSSVWQSFMTFINTYEGQ
jgi:hypothetical protein